MIIAFKLNNFLVGHSYWTPQWSSIKNVLRITANDFKSVQRGKREGYRIMTAEARISRSSVAFSSRIGMERSSDRTVARADRPVLSVNLLVSRPCPGMYVGTSRERSRLSYDYGHYLGQTRLSVSTRSRSGQVSLDSPKSFSTLENYECSFSRVARAFQRARSDRLTVLRPDVDFASALVIQDADSA